MRFTKYDIECLNKVKNLILKDPAKHHTIAEMAKIISFSPSKLKTGFKSRFGMGLYQYLQQQRMEKAVYLLENTDKNIKQISRILGYKYTNNFSASFKKKFGRSPASSRNTFE